MVIMELVRFIIMRSPVQSRLPLQSKKSASYDTVAC